MEKILTSLLKRGVIPYIVAAVVVLAGLSGAAAATGTFSTDSTTTPAGSGSTNQVAGYPAAGGANNIVQVINHSDSRSRMNGRVQLNQIPGPNAGPKNEAFAYSSCVNCRSVAVAVQINLIGPAVRNFQPQNMGLAVNYRCPGCATGAFAIQDFIQVADPTQIPSDVRNQVPAINAQIRDFSATYSTDRSITLADAKAFADGIEAQLQRLVGSVVDMKQDLQTDPTTPGASPLASASSSPESPSASATPTVSGAPTESPQPTPSNSP
jgi:putative peptide zinc metalloprotease protein